jgi:hypothetical protein
VDAVTVESVQAGGKDRSQRLAFTRRELGRVTARHGQARDELRVEGLHAKRAARRLARQRKDLELALWGPPKAQGRRALTQLRIREARAVAGTDPCDEGFVLAEVRLYRISDRSTKQGPAGAEQARKRALCGRDTLGQRAKKTGHRRPPDRSR